MNSEREFMFLESDLKHDLKETSNNYNSRLNLDSMNNRIELDIYSNNIVKTVKWEWDWNDIVCLVRDFPNDPNFALHDVYIRITRKDKKPFTCNDFMYLRSLNFRVVCSHLSIYCDFFTSLFFELIKEQEVLHENNNILFLKIFSFRNLKNGFIKNLAFSKYLSYISLMANNTNNNRKFIYEKYDMEFIYSGKDIHLSEAVDDYLAYNLLLTNYIKRFILEQPFFEINAKEDTIFCSNSLGYNFYINTMAQMLLFFVHPSPFDDIKSLDDDFERKEFESIDLVLDGERTSYKDLIHVRISEFDLYMLCFDERLRDIDNFKKFIEFDFDHFDLKNIKSIDFSKYDQKSFQFKSEMSCFGVYYATLSLCNMMLNGAIVDNEQMETHAVCTSRIW